MVLLFLPVFSMQVRPLISFVTMFFFPSCVSVGCLLALLPSFKSGILLMCVGILHFLLSLVLVMVQVCVKAVCCLPSCFQFTWTPCFWTFSTWGLVVIGAIVLQVPLLMLMMLCCLPPLLLPCVSCLGAVNSLLVAMVWCLIRPKPSSFSF